MSQRFNYCLICENIISSPIVEEIKKPKYDSTNGIFWGLLTHLARKEMYNNFKKATHEIYSNDTKIGETVIIITHDSGNGEKLHSSENLYTVLNKFGQDGWEVVSTSIDYYANDEIQYELEKRYFLKEILLFNDETDENHHLLGKTLLTRTKYLMKQKIEEALEEELEIARTFHF
jgi:hypothetical protein